jgi:hypothetical protein
MERKIKLQKNNNHRDWSDNEIDMKTLYCEICEQDQPVWKMNHECDSVRFCRDCAAFIRNLAKCNERTYMEELEYQLGYQMGRKLVNNSKNE